jgi:hypothetical protein
MTRPTLPVGVSRGILESSFLGPRFSIDHKGVTETLAVFRIPIRFFNLMHEGFGGSLIRLPTGTADGQIGSKQGNG